MSITHRLVVQSDLEDVLALEAQAYPRESWSRLIGHPSFVGAVLQSDPPIQGHKFIGFGCAVMVSRGFLDAELSGSEA